MGRRTTGWFDDKRNVWYVRLGPISERTGKPKPVVLRDEAGEPVAPDDGRGRDGGRRLLGPRPTPTGPAARDACLAYLAWHKAEGSAPRTIKDHWYHLTRFSKFVHAGVRYADRPAADIVPRDLWRIKKSGMGALRQL